MKTQSIATSMLMAISAVMSGTAIAVECSPGYYVSGNSCMDCGNGYYCPDGINRISCRDTVKPGSPEPNAIQSI